MITRPQAFALSNILAGKVPTADLQGLNVVVRKQDLGVLSRKGYIRRTKGAALPYAGTDLGKLALKEWTDYLGDEAVTRVI